MIVHVLWFERPHLGVLTPVARWLLIVWIGHDPLSNRPGLYAAGETMGIYHQVYAGSTSVLRSAVFGRIAALHAARQRHG
jgi:hypothetical protein